MADKGYLALRHLVCRGHQGVLLPMKLFDDERAAKMFMQKTEQETNMLLSAAISVDTPAGPRPLGMVGQFLDSIGVEHIAFELMTCPIEGVLAVPQAPRLIIPGN